MSFCSFGLWSSTLLLNLLVLDLCVSAALDSVKEHTVLPWTSRHVINAPAVAAVPATDILPAEGNASTPATTEPAPQEDADAANVVVETSTEVKTNLSQLTPPGAPEAEVKQQRTLRLNNFTQALKEISPSSSETLGTLADLRKWNDEFGEGRKNKKKRQVWGKGRFGFVNNHKDIPQEGRVANEQSAPEVM